MDTLVSLLSSRTDSSNDEKIIEYAASSTSKLISDWTYAAGTSNHGKYGTYTLALVTALEIPGFPNDIAVETSKNIIDQEIKVIYRALTMVRQAQTIPTISLLKRFAILAPVELFNQFDFTLRVIPKLMTQQPFRQAFLEFYMEMVRRCPAPTRRELLANRKVFSGWFGKLGVEDSEETIVQTLDLLKEEVLKDVTVFTKTTKMGLFNDWTLKNIQRILSNPRISDNLTDQICGFIVLLLCDKTYGVRLPGENKLALSFLKIVKPWENTAQMDLVIRLLHSMPELVVPYFDNLATAYPLTSKVSMWWFSYTVLHIRVLKFDPPKVGSGPMPKLETMSKSVLPVTVNRQVLQQALQSNESALIQFQAAQIVLFALRRLKATISRVYEPRMLDSNPLVDDILNRLPEPQLFTKSVNQELLETTYLIILKEYCQLRPTTLSINKSLDSHEVSGLKLIQAEQILEVQTFTSDQTRWWNPSKGDASLFTQLVKFSTFNVPLADKSSQLLQHLVQPTQLFANIPTLAHPVDALLFSLSSSYQRYNFVPEVVWDLLEQTVQRVIRSPYQYIDKVKTGRVSPFAVALIEQYTQHFANKDTAEGTVKEWLRSFARSLVVLGEDKGIFDELTVGISLASDDAKGRKSDEYFDFVLDEPDNIVINRKDILLKISNRLELAATLYRAVNCTNRDVRNHLLANIPADMLLVLADHPAAFMPFISGSRELCRTFITVLDGKSSEALSESLESSTHWDLALELVSVEFLTNQLLNTLGHDSDKTSAILKELNRRGHIIPAEWVPQLLEIPGLTDSLQLWEPYTMDAQLGRELVDKIQSDFNLVASLIRVSGVYLGSHPLASHPTVLVSAAKFARSQVDERKALETAHLLLKESGNEAKGLSVVAELADSLEASEMSDMKANIWDAISAYIESAKHGFSKSVLSTDLVKIADLEPPFLSRWLKVMVHQLTLRIAERKITDDTLEFLRALNTKEASFKFIWQNVHHNAINALIEAALNMDPIAETYELVSKIALKEKEYSSSHSGTRLLTLSHLTTLFENTKPRECSLVVVLAIYSLFVSNVVSNSTLEVEQGLLVRYDGSISAKDRILLQLLEEIEAQRQRSWVDNVESWEVRPAVSGVLQDIDDYGHEPLIALKNGTSVFVTLDEQRIRQTIQSYEVTETWKVAENVTNYEEILSSIDSYTLGLPESASHYYDSWFLLGSIVSCDFLLQNMEMVVNSGLLSFVICCLSNNDLQETALKVLMHLFNRLPELQFKDQIGARLLIGKLLMLKIEQDEKQQPLPSHIPGMVGQLALVISRPNHFLHEKVCNWLLAAPKIQPFDIPLFKTIFDSQSDLKARELLWLVNTLKSGAVDNTAVQTFVRTGIIEWCLSQFKLLNPKSGSLKEAVHRLMNRIEEVKSGSTTLMTDSGVLGMPELKQRLFYSAGPGEVAKWVN